jgi:3-oxoacyl-[acyl-carrier-protein] synthase III
MRIQTVEHEIPSRCVTNADVLEEFRHQNAARLAPAELELLEERIQKFLALAGTQTRYILADHERAIDLACAAGERALASARLDASEVEFLIFAGVGRGWIDPSMANVFTHQLSLRNATCFDVVDGCASWLRALHVANAYLRGGVYRTGLIINCESAFRGYSDFEFDSVEDIEHRFAMFTIGEAATATVVVADETSDYYSTFRNHGEYYNLCMLGFENLQTFLPEPMDPRCQPRKFFALSRELIPMASRKALELFESDPELNRRTYDICFTHAASERASKLVVERLGIPWSRHVSTHPSYGNTVSASIPLAMSLAHADGRLVRGSKVLAIVGSAGITVGFAAFTY